MPKKIINTQGGNESVTSTVVKEHEKVKLPSKYNVIMHNDDETPMGFVVEILVDIFNKPQDKAVEIMMNVHTTGRGIAGTYIKSIAEAKMMKTLEISENNGFKEFIVTVEKA